MILLATCLITMMTTFRYTQLTQMHMHMMGTRFITSDYNKFNILANV